MTIRGHLIARIDLRAGIVNAACVYQDTCHWVNPCAAAHVDSLEWDFTETFGKRLENL